MRGSSNGRLQRAYQFRLPLSDAKIQDLMRSSTNKRTSTILSAINLKLLKICFTCSTNNIRMNKEY